MTRFHAPPTRWRITDPGFIVGIRPIEPYTPERLEELRVEYILCKQQRDIRSWEVATSNYAAKTKYTVRCIDGEWTCTCSGFAYRGDCSHIEIAKEIAYFESQEEQV